MFFNFLEAEGQFDHPTFENRGKMEIGKQILQNI
jgi:hypothetical protein